MNITELKEQYAILKVQLTDVNSQITNIIKSKNKKYAYANVETSHSVELQSLKELSDYKKEILTEMASIENQLGCSFVKLKNY
jgi:hypothetical protein